ncbi:MAG: hypothetical protein GC206_03340 [Alphaproteobacteria bacterium]|nr:hypothetical protein [Alphaproteobacteria bacterium]
MTLASAACETMTPPEPLELARRNSEARGGAAAIERIRAVELWLDMRDGDTRVRGHYLANREGCVRIDVYERNARVFTEAMTSEGGWNVGAVASEVQANSASGAAALRHGMESPFRLYGLHEYPRRGHRLSSGEPVTIDARNYYRLDVTYTDGYTAEFYLSRGDALVERMRERAPAHLDANPSARRIETLVSDYRDVSGVRIPFITEEIDIDTLETLSSVRVERFLVNTPDALGVCETEPPGA